MAFNETVQHNIYCTSNMKEWVNVRFKKQNGNGLLPDGTNLMFSVSVTYLCEHGFSMVRDHECLVAVQCDGGVVE